MRRRSYTGAVAVLLAGTLLAAGCSTGTDEEPSAGPAEARPASVARVRIATDDYGFPSPFTYLLGPGLVNVNMQYDTLLWKDSTGQPIPWLAKEWSHSPDGREWRFVLRDGVRWHDGQPFTADDVVFTFDYLTNGPGKGNPGVFGPVPGMEVVAESPTVVVFKLPQPIAPFEVTVAGRTVIIPKHVWSTITEPTKVRDPKVLVGTGPYTLESYDSAGPSYLFVANEAYFLGTPYVRRIEFVPAADDLLALRRGEIDTAGIGFEQGVPDTALAPFDDPRFGRVEAPGETTTALHFNLTKGFPFDDKRFRQAVAYAVDRRDLVKRILLGRGAPGSMGGLAPSNIFTAADLPAYEADLNRAKALLDEIGLTDTNGDGVRDLPGGGAFRPELLTTPRWNTKTVELVQEYLKALGVEVRVSSVDYPSFDAATAEARYELALVAYGGLGGDPDALRTRLSSRLNPRSFSRVHGYVNPRFDDLAARQQAAVDTTERTAIVRDMQRIIAEDVPMISLYVANRMQLFDKTVFDAWYFTPGGVFGGYPGVLNKHVFVTGRQTGP